MKTTLPLLAVFSWALLLVVSVRADAFRAAVQPAMNGLTGAVQHDRGVRAVPAQYASSGGNQRPLLQQRAKMQRRRQRETDGPVGTEPPSIAEPAQAGRAAGYAYIDRYGVPEGNALIRRHNGHHSHQHDHNHEHSHSGENLDGADLAVPDAAPAAESGNDADGGGARMSFVADAPDCLPGQFERILQNVPGTPPCRPRAEEIPANV